MLFHSSIRRELARSFGATLVVLVTVVMSMMLIRTLGQASRGGVNPQDVMMVMGYSVLGHLPTILTLSLFIAITATLGRMYRDSEMVIWFSAGRGLAGFLAPLFRFAWPVLLVIALLALVVWPWANQQTQDLKDRYERRGDLDRVSPGQFQENASGSRVFFIDKVTELEAPAATSTSPTSSASSANPTTAATATTATARSAPVARNVFISSTEKGKQSVTSARSGRIDTIDQQRFLLLGNGQRLERDLNQREIKISEFEEYGTRIGSDAVLDNDTPPAKALSTPDLLKKTDNSYQAELAWRIGLALAAINLTLLALALANVNPRGGRGSYLVLTLLAFVVYYNLLNLGFGWISNGKTDWRSYLLMLHGSVFAVGMLWLAVRHNSWTWRNFIRQRTAIYLPQNLPQKAKA